MIDHTSTDFDPLFFGTHADLEKNVTTSNKKDNKSFSLFQNAKTKIPWR
jgi:hypothetical protein